MGSIRAIDLFCGIGGFRIALNQAAEDFGIQAECVFSSDIDPDCQRVYEDNFGERPHGDITRIHEQDMPDHDILLAGFPCQPFSIIGQRKGFDDTRGTLFFDIARIIAAKRPRVAVLENVKQLKGHNQGRTLERILSVLGELGYQADCRVFNALDFGLPQKRERVFIVAFREPCQFDWPRGGEPMLPLEAILEREVDEDFYVSQYIRENRLRKHSADQKPMIWHENKSGHISSYPYSCALRAGASYNYLLVDGERRLTPREMLRLQGFPEDFLLRGTYSQARRQTGNSLPVPVARAVLKSAFAAQGWGNATH